MRKPFNVFTDCRRCCFIALVAPLPKNKQDGFLTTGGEDYPDPEGAPLCEEHVLGFDIKLIPQGVLAISRERRL